jgi:hypothetical protein
MPRPAPVAPPPQRTDHRKSNPKGDRRTTQVNARGWGEGERRIHSPRPRPIDNGGVVVRYVNDLWTNRLDHDLLVLIPDGLLGC